MSATPPGSRQRPYQCRNSGQCVPLPAEPVFASPLACASGQCGRRRRPRCIRRLRILSAAARPGERTRGARNLHKISQAQYIDLLCLYNQTGKRVFNEYGTIKLYLLRHVERSFLYRYDRRYTAEVSMRDRHTSGGKGWVSGGRGWGSAGGAHLV